MKLFGIITFLSLLEYSIGFNSPKSILFFPANFRNNVPRELYGNFISKISDKTNFYICKDNNEENNKLIDEIIDKGEELSIVSHLSSANNVLDLCRQNNKINDVVLINPMNDRLLSSFKFPYVNPLKDILNLDNVEKGINNFLKSNENLQNYQININKEEKVTEPVILDRLLIINKKKSKKWNIFPSFYPMDYLNLDLENYDFENIEIKGKDITEINEYNHFDILDKTWATNLNKILNGESNLERYETLDEYHQEISDLILSNNKKVPEEYCDIEIVNNE